MTIMFSCCSADDEDVARKLSDLLNEGSIKSSSERFRDLEAVVTGDEWQSRFEAALFRARVFVCLIGTEGLRGEGRHPDAGGGSACLRHESAWVDSIAWAPFSTAREWNEIHNNHAKFSHKAFVSKSETKDADWKSGSSYHKLLRAIRLLWCNPCLVKNANIPPQTKHYYICFGEIKLLNRREMESYGYVCCSADGIECAGAAKMERDVVEDSGFWPKPDRKLRFLYFSRHGQREDTSDMCAASAANIIFPSINEFAVKKTKEHQIEGSFVWARWQFVSRMSRGFADIENDGIDCESIRRQAEFWLSVGRKNFSHKSSDIGPCRAIEDRRKYYFGRRALRSGKKLAKIVDGCQILQFPRRQTSSRIRGLDSKGLAVGLSDQAAELDPPSQQRVFLLKRISLRNLGHNVEMMLRDRALSAGNSD